MARVPDSFRDFGIMPQGLPPPPETVRSFLSTGRIVGQFIATGLVTVFGLGMAVVFVLTLPFPLNLLGCAAALAGFGAFVYLATHNDYRWVELDGATLRAKHLYTGRVIERPVSDVECLMTMAYLIRRTATVVVEAMLGRVKGIEIRFRDWRTPMRVVRSDPAMTNARALIEAVIFRMAQVGEVDAEIVNFAGQPMVRCIHWKGERPAVQRGKAWKVMVCCFVLLAMIFASILGWLGGQEERRLALLSVPAQTLPLRTLVEQGPGTNPHVIVTDFHFGGYAFETKDKTITAVWIAMFPTGEKGEDRSEIKAVLDSRRLRDKAAIDQFKQQGRAMGICSASPGFTYGTIRTNLITANPGSQLVAAWCIEEETEPMSAAAVRGLQLGSAACYAVVLAVALLVALKKA